MTVRDVPLRGRIEALCAEWDHLSAAYPALRGFIGQIRGVLLIDELRSDLSRAVAD